MERVVGVVTLSVLTGVMSAYGWARGYLFLGELFGLAGDVFRYVGMTLSCVAGLVGLWVGFHVGAALAVDR